MPALCLLSQASYSYSYSYSSPWRTPNPDILQPTPVFTSGIYTDNQLIYYSSKIVEELIHKLTVQQIWEYSISRSAGFAPDWVEHE